MRVTFNAFSDSFVSQLGRLNARQIELQKQLSSGQRITEANDDPLAMGRALASTTEKSRIQAQTRNLNRAELVGSFTLDTLSQLKIIADTANQVGNTTDGLTSSADFRARALQINQLVEQGLRVGNSQIAGDFLFAGANTGEQPYVPVRYTEFLQDANGDFVDLSGNPTATPVRSVYVDAQGNPVFEPLLDRFGDPVSDSVFIDTTLSPGVGDPLSGRDIVDGAIVEWDAATATWQPLLDGDGNRFIPRAGPTGADPSGTGALTNWRDIQPEMVGMVSHIVYTGTSDPANDVSFRIGENASISPFSRGVVNEQYRDFFNNLIALRDAYFKEDLQEVESLIPVFDDSQQLVNLGLVEFGSLLRGIEVTARINEARFNELEKLSSRELDIDTAETIIQLNRSQTAYEAALSSGSRILGLSLLDFI